MYSLECFKTFRFHFKTRKSRGKLFPVFISYGNGRGPIKIKNISEVYSILYIFYVYDYTCTSNIMYILLKSRTLLILETDYLNCTKPPVRESGLHLAGFFH